MYLIGFPLLVIPFAIYNMIAFLMPGLSWTDKVASFHLASGTDWIVSSADILVTLAVLLLPLEILKATRIGIRLRFWRHQLPRCAGGIRGVDAAGLRAPLAPTYGRRTGCVQGQGCRGAGRQAGNLRAGARDGDFHRGAGIAR